MSYAIKGDEYLTVSAPVWDIVNIRNYIEIPEIDAIKVKVQTQTQDGKKTSQDNNNTYKPEQGDHLAKFILNKDTFPTEK